MGFSGGSDCKESTCNVGDLGFSLDWEDPLEKHMATHSSILAWRILMDRGFCSLAGCRPWGCKELDTTEGLSAAQNSCSVSHTIVSDS